MRIFIAPAEISGICARLKIGLRELGHSATFIAPAGRNSVFDYGEIDDPIPAPLAQLFQDEKARQFHLDNFKATKGPLFERVLEFLLHQFWLLRNIFRFVRFAREYDAFVFQYCSSLNLRSHFVKFNDLFWLRLLGKKVIFVVTGSEGRPSYLDGAIMHQFVANGTEWVNQFTKFQRDANREADKYASCVINNMFTSYFYKRPCVPLQIVGFAVTLGVEPQPYPDDDGDRPVVIVHCPSTPIHKGTSQITRMIEELKQEGFNIDFRTLIRRTNREVIDEVSRCDFVVDQMYIDLPLAVFASEAAYLARPAVVGGYLSKEELTAAYKYYGIPPSEYCHPSEMKNAIRKLIVDVAYRRRLGEDARNYVTKYWSPKAVAERYLRIIEGNVPKDWYWDPMELDKALPVCISAEWSGELISNIVEKHGESALFLDDKPKIKASALKLMRDWREKREFGADKVGTAVGATGVGTKSGATGAGTDGGAKQSERESSSESLVSEGATK